MSSKTVQVDGDAVFIFYIWWTRCSHFRQLGARTIIAQYIALLTVKQLLPARAHSIVLSAPCIYSSLAGCSGRICVA